MNILTARGYPGQFRLFVAQIKKAILEGFSDFVTSMTAPVVSGWSKIAGWELHPLENAALTRCTPQPVIQRQTKTATLRPNATAAAFAACLPQLRS